jgi:type IV secretory pathway TraG/TraD family ATPase VirD4
MLTQLFKAARIEHQPPLSYAGHFIHLGMIEAARRLEELSIARNLPAKDNLATRFLDVTFEDADFENRFLQDAWSTLTGKIEPIITETILKSVAGSDFSPLDILAGTRPVTIYFRWPEKHVQAYTPLIRLVWSSLIDGLCALYDERRGHNCRPVLALLDEAGRAPIAGLPEYAATVVGRHISLWVAYQSRSQPAAIYGDKRAEILWDNMDSIVYYRPATGNRTTGKYLEDRLGEMSGFAHSETAHEGEQTSEGKSEKAIPLLSAWDIHRMGDTQIIGFHRDLAPFRADRMNYLNFAELVRRSKIQAPPVFALPAVPDIPELTEPATSEMPEFFDPDGST